MEPAEEVFRFSTVILAIPFVTAAVCTIVAIGLAWAGKKPPAAVCGLIALLAGLGFGPAMFNDRVVVTDSGVTQTTGFPWSPTRKGFAYADVERVSIVVEPHGVKRRDTLLPRLQLRDGTVRDLDPGDLWVLNSDAIVERVRAAGVPVDE